MTVEENKQVVRNLFQRLGTGKMDEAMMLLAEDVKWWVQGHGDHDKAQMRATWSPIFSGAPGPEAMKIRGLVAEADRVSAELESDIPLPDGRRFQNTYHIVFMIRGGKIVQAREYFDTAYAQAFFASKAS